MAIIFRADNIGRVHQFRIKGEEPSPTETARLEAFLAEKNAEFPTPPTQDEGPSRFGVAARDLGLNLSSAGEQAARGLGFDPDGWSEYNRQTREGLAADQAKLKSYWDLGAEGDIPGAANALIQDNLPSMLPTIAGGVAGGAAFGPVGAVVGGGLAALPMFFGSNVERQISTGVDPEEVDRAIAILSAVPQAALDGVVNAFLPGAGKIIENGVLTAAGRLLAEKGLLPTVAKEAAKAAGVESVTEVGQQAIERGQAGLSVTDAEAQREFLEAGLAGGILGGSLGGVSAGIDKSTANRAFRDEQEGERQLQRDMEAEDANIDRMTELARKWRDESNEMLALPAPEQGIAGLLPPPRSPVTEGPNAGVMVDPTITRAQDRNPPPADIQAKADATEPQQDFQARQYKKLMEEQNRRLADVQEQTKNAQERTEQLARAARETILPNRALSLAEMDPADAGFIRMTRMRQGLPDLEGPVTLDEIKSTRPLGGWRRNYYQGQVKPETRGKGKIAKPIPFRENQISEPSVLESDPIQTGRGFTEPEYDQIAEAVKRRGEIDAEQLALETGIKKSRIDSIVRAMGERGDAVKKAPATYMPSDQINPKRANTPESEAAKTDTVAAVERGKAVATTYSVQPASYEGGVPNTWTLQGPKGEAIATFEKRSEAFDQKRAMGAKGRNLKIVGNRSAYSVVEERVDADGNTVTRAARASFPNKEAAEAEARKLRGEPEPKQERELSTGPKTGEMGVSREKARDKKLDPVRKILRERASALGLDDVDADAVGLIADPEGGVITGVNKRENGKNTVRIAAANFDPEDADFDSQVKKVADEEFFHATVRDKLWKPEEYSRLKRLVRTKKVKGRKYTFQRWAERTYGQRGEYDPAGIEEEAIAKFLVDAINDPDIEADTEAKGLIGKARKIIKAILDTFRTKSDDGKDLVELFSSGELGRTRSRAGAEAYGLDPETLSSDKRFNVRAKTTSDTVNAGEQPESRPDGKIELVHWSSQERDVLDVAKRGTGPMRGEERQRTAGTSVRDRLYFGVNVGKPGGYVKEPSLGEYAHVVAADPGTLYNWWEDPMGLKASLDRSASGPEQVTQYETLIKEAGFDGYWVKGGTAGDAAVVWRNMEVESSWRDPAVRSEFLSSYDFVVEKALTKPGWAIITGTKESVGAWDAPENVKNNERLKKELGPSAIEVIGRYEGVDQGPSYIAFVDEDEALKLGQKYGQDSVLTSRGFIYSDGRRVPALPEQTVIGARAKKEPFYSELPSGTAFSVGLDWENEEKPRLNARRKANKAQGAFDPKKADIRFNARTKFNPDDHPLKLNSSIRFLDDSFDLPKEALAGLPEVAAYLQKEALRQLKGKPIEGPDPKTDRLVAETLASETLAAIRRAEANGVRHAADWYTNAMDKAVAIAGALHPELLNSTEARRYDNSAGFRDKEDARSVFFAAMAITSQDMKVEDNAKAALEQYRFFLENGRFNPKGYGTKGRSIEENLRLFNRLLEDVVDGDVGKLRRFLSHEFTVREMNAAMRPLGLKVGGELTSERVFGSAVFGPKIGNGFYQNLAGNYDPVTIDKWFMRTWGRLTGTLVGNKEAYDGQRRRFIDAAVEHADELKGLGIKVNPNTIEKLSGPKLLELARQAKVAWEGVYARMREEGATKEKLSEAKTRWGNPASGFYNAQMMPNDNPGSGGFRKWVRSVIAQALENLRENDLDITSADLQALLWYPEKDLYNALQDKPKGKLNTSYDTAFEKIAKSEGITDEEIDRAIRALERDGRGGRPDPSEEDSDRSIARAARTGGQGLSGREVERFREQGRFSARMRSRSRVEPVTRASTNELTLDVKYNNIASLFRKLGARGILSKRTADLLSDRAEGALVKLQDRMLPVGRMVDEIKAAGGKIRDYNDPYLREELFGSRAVSNIEDREKGMYKDLIERVKGLGIPDAEINRIGAVNAKAREILDQHENKGRALLDLYLYAKAAPGRNARLRAMSQDLSSGVVESGSGLTDAEAAEILKAIEASKFAGRLREAEKLFRAIIKDTNDTRVRGGLIPLTTAEGGEPFYAPLRNPLEEDPDGDDPDPVRARTGKGFSVRGREDRRATGRSSLAANILEHAILQNMEAQIRAEKNLVAQSFLDLVESNPTQAKPFAEILERAPTKLTVVDGKIRWNVDPKYLSDPSYFVVRQGDKHVVMKIHDERIGNAMNGIGYGSDAGMVVNALAKVNRYLAAVNTSYNPEFVISNALRDIQTAMVNAGVVDKSDFRKKILSNWWQARRAVWNALSNEDTSGEWGEVFEEFRSAGGMTAFQGERTLKDTIDDVREEISEDAPGMLKWSKQKFEAVTKPLVDANETVENALRLSVYKAARDSGISVDRSAQLAKNITVNFNKGGEYKVLMGAMYLFYNASIQGTFAMLNAMRSPQVRKIWGGVVVAGLAQDLILPMLFPDDEDGENIYDKIPEWVKERNLIIPAPGTDRGYLSIPMPYGFNAAYGLGRNIGTVMRGEKDPGEAGAASVGLLFDTLSPIGGFTNVVNTIAPTLVDPLVDLYATNKDFAGNPIVPERGGFGPDAPLAYTTSGNTNPVFVGIGQWLNRISGGTVVVPGDINVSPDRMQYAFDYLLGAAGATALRAGTNMYDLATGNIDDVVAERGLGQITMIRKFASSISESTDLGSFIEGRDRVMMAERDLKEALEQGDREGALRLRKKWENELRIAGAIKGISNQRNKLVRAIRKIEEDPRMPEERKRELVTRLRSMVREAVIDGNRILNEAGI